MKDTKKLAIILALAMVFLLTVKVVVGVAPNLTIADNNVDEDSGLTQYNLHNFANDAEDAVSNLTFSLDSQSNSSVINCVLNVDGHTLGCTTIADQSGNNTIKVTVTDTSNETATDYFTIIVNPVNDAPVANGDAVTVFAGVLESVTVLSNDYDIDGDALTIGAVTTPANGTAVVNGNSVSYTANQGFEGTDTFKYTINDGKGGTSTATVAVTAKLVLSIEKVKINDRTNGELNLGEVNEVEVDVQNDFTADLLDVVVKATLLDVDGDDLGKESNEFDLDASDEERLDFKFDLKGKDLDDDSYILEIVVEGEDSSGKKYHTVEKLTVDVDRKKHQVVIRSADLQKANLQCSDPFASIFVSIKNIGKSNEDNVEIRVRNNDLNIDLSKSNLQLDKFSDRDNYYQTNFALDLTGAEPGSYTLSVEVFRDGNLDDQEEMRVTVPGCASSSLSDEQSKDNIFDLQRKLQEGLQERNLQKKSVLESSFRESKFYTLLLGFLLVFLLVAIILALAVLTFKK